MFYKLEQGVRQGSVLSPIIFAICIDVIVGQHVFPSYFKLFLFADDVLIVSGAVSRLQAALLQLETDLKSLDMRINEKKCVCVRVGRHFNSPCSVLALTDGRTLPWSQELRYLGIFIKAGQYFRCNYSSCKLKFIRSANCLFAKLAHHASEEVMLSLMVSKCLPALLYGLEACPVLSSDVQSLDFVVSRFIFKLFRTSTRSVVDEIINMFNIPMPSRLATYKNSTFSGDCKIV